MLFNIQTKFQQKVQKIFPLIAFIVQREEIDYVPIMNKTCMSLNDMCESDTIITIDVFKLY